MPPQLASLANSISTATSPAFVCSLCRFHRSVYTIRRKTNASSYSYASQHLGRRKLASTASATAINAKRVISPSFQELHTSLTALGEKASTHINSSQLQLALRGLESENAVTRVAVLGVNGQRGARRLARTLLADPLLPESEWERQLLDGDDGDGRSLLVRYRAEPEVDQRHPLIKTLSIPAPSLLTHNLEILIQAIPETSDTSGAGDEAETFLLPSLELNSSTGRISMGTFPVHRSVIYARGLQNTSTLAANLPGQMIKKVIDAGWSNLQDDAVSDQSLNPINLTLAESAINSFRASVDNGLEYEHGWFDSGLVGVSAWFFDGLNGKASGLQPSLRQLVEKLCNSAERAIIRQEALDSKHRTITAMPIATRDSLGQDTADWAEFAHIELRNQLDLWFSSKNWKRLAWWKLFWRVDDISPITSDVLQRAWLVEAEKEMIWLFGRLEQAGLRDPEKRIRRPVVVMRQSLKLTTGAFPNAPMAKGLIAPTAMDPKQDRPPVESIPRHWPQGISIARSSLSATTIPPLQALAQRLLLETLSTTLLTSSLSALVYMSLSSPSVYEAGAIAALGLVYSLHRLQGQWGLARDAWEKIVREEGRSLLRGLETKMRTMVQEGGKQSIDERTKERRAARQSVENVRRALERLQ